MAVSLSLLRRSERREVVLSLGRDRFDRSVAAMLIQQRMRRILLAERDTFTMLSLDAQVKETSSGRIAECQ